MINNRISNTTTLNRDLLKEAKIFAVMNDKNLNDIIEEALNMFLKVMEKSNNTENDIIKVLEYFKSKKWVIDEDYDIITRLVKSNVFPFNTQFHLCVTFKIKENKDIIDYLESEGWFEDQKYTKEDLLMTIMAKEVGVSDEEVTHLVYKAKEELYGRSF